ncbi:MAG TPA: hypothetical protein VN455_10225 [Methanotrichaceae archaeon]|nr:hypothetical protein [Methanotrichaceae archaeon]
MSIDFNSMSFDEKVQYVIENLRSLPGELAVEGVDLLAQAGETEYAVVLARDKGMIKRAIDILVSTGDYLWAAMIAKNAGMAEESERLYSDGLGYYINMEMYGRAISAATALGLPQEEIDALFQKGVEVESRNMDMGRVHAMLDSAMESLEISMIGKEDELSNGLRTAIQREKDRRMKDLGNDNGSMP